MGRTNVSPARQRWVVIGKESSPEGDMSSSMFYGLKTFRPSSRAMQYTKNLYLLAMQPIHHDKWRTRYDQFPCALNAANTAKLRELFQHVDSGKDTVYCGICCCRISFVKVGVHGLQIIGSLLCPADFHRFRRHLRAIFFTSSWSMSLPASACRIEALICSICHS